MMPPHLFAKCYYRHNNDKVWHKDALFSELKNVKWWLITHADIVIDRVIWLQFFSPPWWCLKTKLLRKKSKLCSVSDSTVDSPRHDDVTKLKHFPRYWAFVKGIHRWPVDSPHKGQWGVTMICAFLSCAHEQMVEPTVDMPVIWDAMSLIVTSLSWETERTPTTQDISMRRLCYLCVTRIANQKISLQILVRVRHATGVVDGNSWWRHQMETFAALLALCAGNSPVPGNSSVPGNSPHKGQWRGTLMFSLIYVWINGWVNNREASDLRRYRGHYDVSVMCVGKMCPVQVHDSRYNIMINQRGYFDLLHLLHTQRSC